MQEYNTLLLEISGEKGKLESYLEVIDFSLTLGINRVLFCAIWDNEEKKGEEMFDELQQYCNDKNMIVIPDVSGYYGAIYRQPMLTKTDAELRVIESFSKVVPLKVDETIDVQKNTFVKTKKERLN